MRIAGQALAQIGALLVHQHERHVQPLHVRTRRPVQHRHELRRGLRVQAAGSPDGKHVRRLIDDDRQAQAVGFGGHEVVAHEAIEQREGRRWSFESALRSPTLRLASVTISFSRCSSRPAATRSPRPRS